jgi:nicotinamidase-related amidase
MPQLLIGQPLLLIIDMQNDFVDGGRPCANVDAEFVVPTIGQVLDAARQASLPIIWTVEAHRPSGRDRGLEGSEDCPIAEHTVEGTRGSEIVEPLAPGADDLVVSKRRYNCFLGTELDLLLRSLRIDTLLVTGVSSDVCVHWTVGEAFQRDYHVRVLEDCVAGTSRDDHRASLQIMRNLVSAGQAFHSGEALAAIASLD